MAHFNKKIIAITGAASGIGLATAKKLAGQGVLLSLADRDGDRLKAVVPMLAALYPTPMYAGNPNGQGSRPRTPSQQPSLSASTTGGSSPNYPLSRPEILTTTLDITDADGCNGWIQRTITHFNRPLDAAVNMAGIVGPSLGLPAGSIRNVSLPEYHNVMTVNALGTFNLLRAELPHMATTPSTSSIVNAASIAGIMGVPNNVPYVMAKHAIVGLTKTAAKEEGGRGIRVNAIAPGVVDTPMVEGIGRLAGTTELFTSGGQPGSLGRMGRSEEVADLVCFLAGGESSFISGMIYGIDGGWMC